MESSETILALLKLGILLAVFVGLLRLRAPLWLTICSGTLALAGMCGIGPTIWPDILLGVLRQRDFFFLCLMVYLILVLSGVQEATGQNSRLVAGLKSRVRDPRFRLVLFPALIGLLPMPGGALFSCPMLKEAAHGVQVTDQKKALINYWFRHIWELAWPLYPGYALACALLNISPTLLWRYTFPLVLLAFAVGWIYYMRELARPSLAVDGCSENDAPLSSGQTDEASFASLFAHTLPIVITLLGTVVFGFLFARQLPEAPGTLAFSLSLALAVATALFQGRGHMGKPLRGLMLNLGIGRIMLLLFAIFLFKETLTQSGLIASLSPAGGSVAAVITIFILAPLIGGMLTGLMVGFVGVSFPILLGLLAGSPLQEYSLPLFVLALVSGNCGQLLSPLHICLVVTCEYFTTPLASLWKLLLRPVAALMIGGFVWAGFLAALGVHF